MWQTLLNQQFREKIERILPTLFNMAELESKRGNKIGMEVGNVREKIIIALFMYVYGQDSVSFPPTTSHELDVILHDNPISIKTKLYKKNCDYDGVKLTWTTDWQKVQEFMAKYRPQSDMVFVNVVWGGSGAFHIIKKETQQKALDDNSIHWYCKIPRQGTNFRGVPMSKEALQLLAEHHDTQKIPINWVRDRSLLEERALYRRWEELWDAL